MHITAKIVALTALTVAASPAFASMGATGGARITAHVPAVCDISADTFVLTGSGLISGSVQEFCNTSTAYQVLASHRPLAISEEATVRYGARVTSLDDSGLAAVAFRSGQRLETVQVEIDAQSLSAPLAVAFTLSAI